MRSGSFLSAATQVTGSPGEQALSADYSTAADYSLTSPKNAHSLLSFQAVPGWRLLFA